MAQGETPDTRKVDWSQAAKLADNLSRRALKPVYKKWAFLYLAFTRKRFAKMSKAGWKRLKHPRAIDVRRARKGKKGKRLTSGERAALAKKAKPLRDTGLLLNALTLGQPGNMMKYLRHGVRVGFGGKAKHGEGGRATIADIARFHNAGKGKLPKRQILAEPSIPLVRRFLTVLKKRWREMK